MDACNHFESQVTFRLMRLEQLAALFVSMGLFFWHITEVRWLPAVVLFAYIDLIGYLPGLLAQRRSLAAGNGGRIAPVYYVLYNVMHSFLTQGAVVGLWVLIAGWEWALLVVPIHLCGDRSVFGNSLKPLTVPFDTKRPLPAFVEFERRLVARPALAPEPASSR